MPRSGPILAGGGDDGHGCCIPETKGNNSVYWKPYSSVRFISGNDSTVFLYGLSLTYHPVCFVP